MNLSDIIATANQAYPDDLVEQAAGGGKVGDGLAEFIVRELKDTYEEEFPFLRRVQEAALSMENALEEIRNVHQALSELADDLKSIEEAQDLPLLIGTFENPIAQKYLEQAIKEASDARS